MLRLLVQGVPLRGAETSKLACNRVDRGRVSLFPAHSSVCLALQEISVIRILHHLEIDFVHVLDFSCFYFLREDCFQYLESESQSVEAPPHSITLTLRARILDRPPRFRARILSQTSA